MNEYTKLVETLKHNSRAKYHYATIYNIFNELSYASLHIEGC